MQSIKQERNIKELELDVNGASTIRYQTKNIEHCASVKERTYETVNVGTNWNTERNLKFSANSIWYFIIWISFSLLFFVTYAHGLHLVLKHKLMI